MPPTSVWAQSSSPYQLYLQLGKKALRDDDFEKAYFYIQAAYISAPQRAEAQRYLETIPHFPDYQYSYAYYMTLAYQALDDSRFHLAYLYFDAAHNVNPSASEPQDNMRRLKFFRSSRQRRPRLKRISKRRVVKRIKKGARPTKSFPILAKRKKSDVKSIVKIKKDLSSYEEVLEGEGLAASQVDEITRFQTDVREFKKEKLAKKKKMTFKREDDSVVVETLLLSDEWRASQSSKTIEIEIGQSVILEGQNIRRYLAITPDMIEVFRLDRNRIEIKSLKRGATLFHMWDDRGRWTFNVVGRLPEKILSEREKRKKQVEEHVDNFRFGYSNNWSTFYVGDSVKNLEQESLFFRQWLGISGPTPYGHFDGSINYFKFKESTELVGQTLGLTDAHFGSFKDFSIRGFDATKRFSELSLPGRSFRGVLLDAYAFQRRLKYSLLKGQDRSVFLTVSPGSNEERNSYIEGAQLTLFPDEESQLSFNYARGYGDERLIFLKDKVFSIEAQKTFKGLFTQAELAYDEDVFASVIRTRLDQENYSLRVNFRDVDKNFLTITSRSSATGEVGGNIIFDWEPKDQDIQFSTNIDIYRDREIPNEENPNGVNLDLGIYFSKPLTKRTKYNSSLFYVHTPQLISPRDNIKWNNTLSHTFKIWQEKSLTTFLTGSYQRSRFDFSSSSEFDRYSLRAGFRLPLIDSLSYFANYEYSWVDEVESGETNSPTVFLTGLSFSKRLSDVLSGRLSFFYRDEQNAESDFSFLSGQDDIRTNFGLSYRPNQDMEVFMDGSFRNVWSENQDQAAFNDADLRLGLRSSWDLLFRWDPKGYISGVVFKDLDGNGLQNNSEPGMADIVIRVGKKSAKTNKEGQYATSIRAKKIVVAMNTGSIPQGFLLSTDLEKEVEIQHLQSFRINFGLTARTSIYGVVFVDDNKNKALDRRDKRISNMKLTLDGKQTTKSNADGTYYFENVTPGKHTLILDVNSLPLQYLPMIKIKNTFQVKEGSTFTLHVPLKEK